MSFSVLILYPSWSFDAEDGVVESVVYAVIVLGSFLYMKGFVWSVFFPILVANFIVGLVFLNVFKEFYELLGSFLQYSRIAIPLI